MKSMLTHIKKIKVSYLDFAVIISVLVVVCGLLFFRSQKKEEWVNLTMMVVNEDLWWYGVNPPYWYVNDVEAGDQAFNSLGTVVGEITDINVFDMGGPQKRALVKLKLKVTYDQVKDDYVFNYKPLEIGQSLNLSFKSNNLRGVVTTINDSSLPEPELQDKRIWILVKELRPEYVSEYQPGLAMTDSNGTEVAVIEKVVKVENAIEEFYSDIRGRMVQTRSQLLEDVTLQVKIKTSESKGSYYFIDRSVIKLGDKIWFHFPRIVIDEAEIIKIIE